MSVEPLHPCERVCEYAIDVGVPEYSALNGLRNDTNCGNCDHYSTPTPAPEKEQEQ